MGDVRTKCTAGTPEPAHASTGLICVDFTEDLRNRTQKKGYLIFVVQCCCCCRRRRRRRWDPNCSASKMHNLSLRSSNGCKARARGVTHCEAISTRVLRALLLRLRAVSLGLGASWLLSCLGRHSWPTVSMVSAVADQSTGRQLASQLCRRSQHRARQALL